MSSNTGGAQGAGARIESAAYVNTFFRELSPVWLSYVAALRGLRTCRLDGPFSYMELGCGLGHSAIVNAAAFPAGEFHACDFNPAHIAAARAHAAAIGVDNIEFHESSFETLLERDLPAFDFIVLHGVYSWVDARARHAVRAFIQQRLKTNGLVYVSYNCMPGWALEAPLRRLLVELADGEAGSLAEKAEQALRKLRILGDAGLAYFNVNMAARGAVDAYAKQPRDYLVHEFLTDSWTPFYSVDVADEMREVGLEYVGSATLVDNHQALMLESRVMGAMAALKTERERRLAEDFAMNRYFRRDVFARGVNAVDGRAFGDVVVGRIEVAPLQPQIRVPRGVVSFQSRFVEEVQAMLSQGSMTIVDLLGALCGGPDRNSAEILRNITFLIAAGALTPFARLHRFEERMAPPGSANAQVRKVLDYSVEHRTGCVIPSEVLGNGVEIEPLEALAIAQILAGAAGLEDLAGRLTNAASESANGDPGAVAESIAHRAAYEIWPKLARLGLVAGAPWGRN
jgi:trans-aconitate methyltransferase